MLEIVGWLGASAVVMALVEYLFHRFPMHNLRFIRRFGFGRELFDAHAVLHHGRYYQESFVNDPDPASRRISIRMSALEHVAAAALFAVPFGYWVSVVGAACFLVVVALHAIVWTAVHIEMHMPEGRWFSRTRYYQYVRDWHHAHHLYPGTNFAAVFPPVIDWLFGTYHKPVPVVMEAVGA